ncbi:MAG TPA: hypothetical protein VMS98_20485 [Thermoanaerobaculia bacterium]|nr:hypothetical protein [Thermoanaerobaculia bacterium]
MTTTSPPSVRPLDGETSLIDGVRAGEERFTLLHGDLRDRDLFAGVTFDLLLGSPPYFPPGSATEAVHPQAEPARIETRGTVADYAADGSTPPEYSAIRLSFGFPPGNTPP